MPEELFTKEKQLLEDLIDRLTLITSWQGIKAKHTLNAAMKAS